MQLIAMSGAHGLRGEGLVRRSLLDRPDLADGIESRPEVGFRAVPIRLDGFARNVFCVAGALAG